MLSVEAKQLCCGGYKRCCGGYTPMLQRLNSHVVEAIQPCCGGYAAMLQRLCNNVAEAMLVLLPIIIPPGLQLHP
jgi:hypothetical protein